MDASSSTRLQLPLFPLRTVLFPGGLLPLQIFEPRYLDMIGRCHRAGEPFGVVCLSLGSEVRRPAPGPGGDGFAPEAFHPVGTLARIDALQRPQAGLLLIRCTGTQRFRVQRSAQQKFGLWVGDVELLADDAPVPVPDDLASARDGLQGVVRNIEHSIALSDEAGFEMPIARPYRWDDCGWLANRWCEMLPLEAAQKQRLMAIDSPLLRLELVADALGQLGLRPGG
jgi:Lon protease-like protein